MTVTAVEGGHVDSIEASNNVIREIVEARNKARDEEEVAQEIREDLKKAGDMSAVEPLVGVFDVENPKDIIGSDKLPLSLWPSTATAMGCIALLNGNLKYGRSNWRAIGVRATVYVDALMRHVSAWADDGEWADEEGVPHLGSALACLAILVDCHAAGLLKDDRPIKGGYKELAAELTPIVASLRELHAGKSPKHYTIGDSQQ